MIDPSIIFAIVAGLPPWLGTMILAALPVAELRLSLPVALIVYKMPVVTAYFYSVIGNMIPIIPILLLFGPAHKLLDSVWPFKPFFQWLLARVEKHRGKFETYGALALISFVAIPLPVTGAWTGSIAAFVFKVPRRQAFLMLLVGVMIAGIIVIGATKTGLMTHDALLKMNPSQT
jgi:uncharacterized membrane protein